MIGFFAPERQIAQLIDDEQSRADQGPMVLSNAPDGAVVSCNIKSAAATKRVISPAWVALYPKAILRCVFPAPEGPKKTTFSLRSMNARLVSRYTSGPNPGETAGHKWGPSKPELLIVHSERGSRQSNAVEGEIIERVLAARADHRANSIAVITPHRAQRALLRGRLGGIPRRSQLLTQSNAYKVGSAPRSSSRRRKAIRTPSVRRQASY